MAEQSISKEICLIDRLDGKTITQYIVQAVKENKVKSIKTDYGTLIMISI